MSAHSCHELAKKSGVPTDTCDSMWNCISFIPCRFSRHGIPGYTLTEHRLLSLAERKLANESKCTPTRETFRFRPDFRLHGTTKDDTRFSPLPSQHHSIALNWLNLAALEKVASTNTPQEGLASLWRSMDCAILYRLKLPFFAYDKL